MTQGAYIYSYNIIIEAEKLTYGYKSTSEPIIAIFQIVSIKHPIKLNESMNKGINTQNRWTHFFLRRLV